MRLVEVPEAYLGVRIAPRATWPRRMKGRTRSRRRIYCRAPAQSSPGLPSSRARLRPSPRNAEIGASSARHWPSRSHRAPRPQPTRAQLATNAARDPLHTNTSVKSNPCSTAHDQTCAPTSASPCSLRLTESHAPSGASRTSGRPVSRDQYWRLSIRGGSANLGAKPMSQGRPRFSL
jgi:hypothetical protein